MNATSIDIGDLLDANGFGPVFIGQEPDSLVLTTTLYDTGGEAPNPKFLLDEPRIQIRSRSFNFVEAQTNLSDIVDFLLGKPKFTQGGTLYVSLMANADIVQMPKDEKDRIAFVTTFNIVREPSTGVNRIPLC